MTRTRTYWHLECWRRLRQTESTDAVTYPYLCGEAGCREHGVVLLTMPEITAHWRGHHGKDD